ncbi:MAG: stage 0 sporulation family protein [bacterium]
MNGTKVINEDKIKTVVDIMLCSSTNLHCCLGLVEEDNTDLKPGSYVIIESGKGQQIGKTISLPYKMKENARCQQKKLVKILRPAHETDIKKLEQQIKKEKEAYQICREKVEEQEIDMKIVNVEYHPAENTYYYFYTADKRIDCRELSKDLAYLLKAKIELRQIGARDEGSLLGGVGSCGYQLCCTMFSIDELPSVSMKMAKAQNLALNPTRISGLCGRLMCCLAYEFDAYKNNIKPKGKNKPQPEQEEDNAEEEENNK